MQNEKLWKALQSFQFDDGFAASLANENGWDSDFTQRAVTEYRKFLFLSQVSDTPVTPSLLIDKVWHEHMMYSRNYWDALCKDVLGKPLHHEPGRSATDIPRYEDQYRRTRALYTSCFGESPPDEFWAQTQPSNLRKRLTLLVASVVAILGALATGRSDVFVGSLLVVVVIWELGGMPLLSWNTASKKNGNANCATSCASSCGGSGCGGD